jgi:hypothetical protein
LADGPEGPRPLFFSSRRIPIGRKLKELLDQAIGTRTGGPVFLSPAGKAWTVPNLSRTYSRLRDDAGLLRDLVLYLARHECGTKICREKGIEYARRLLGHANISTTQRYMYLDDRELAEAQDLVPRSNCVRKTGSSCSFRFDPVRRRPRSPEQTVLSLMNRERDAEL